MKTEQADKPIKLNETVNACSDHSSASINVWWCAAYDRNVQSQDHVEFTPPVKRLWRRNIHEYAVEIGDFAFVLCRRVSKTKFHRLVWENRRSSPVNKCNVLDSRRVDLIERSRLCRFALFLYMFECTESIARNLGQNGRRDSRVTFKMAPKEYRKMYGERLFFPNNCPRMGHSFAA